MTSFSLVLLQIHTKCFFSCSLFNCAINVSGNRDNACYPAPPRSLAQGWEHVPTPFSLHAPPEPPETRISLRANSPFFLSDAKDRRKPKREREQLNRYSGVWDPEARPSGEGNTRSSAEPKLRGKGRLRSLGSRREAPGQRGWNRARATQGPKGVTHRSAGITGRTPGTTPKPALPPCSGEAQIEGSSVPFPSSRSQPVTGRIWAEWHPLHRCQVGGGGAVGPRQPRCSHVVSGLREAPERLAAPRSLLKFFSFYLFIHLLNFCILFYFYTAGSY